MANTTGVRVTGDLIVVPPFDCAWLSGEGSKLASPKEGGCISFEARGQTDITVILKAKPSHGPRAAAATKRFDHWSGGVGDNRDGADDADRNPEPGMDGEQTYLVIIGSHRNTCLCIEKNGKVMHTAKGKCLLPDNADHTFTRFWVSWSFSGLLAVALASDGDGTSGRPLGSGDHYAWQDPHPVASGVELEWDAVGLSTWDSHVCYRNIEMLPPMQVPRFMDVEKQAFAAAASAVAVAGSAPSGLLGMEGSGAESSTAVSVASSHLRRDAASTGIRGAPSWLDEFDGIADVAVVYTSVHGEQGPGLRRTRKGGNQRGLKWGRENNDSPADKGKGSVSKFPYFVEVTARPIDEVRSMAVSPTNNITSSTSLDYGNVVPLNAGAVPSLRPGISHATLLAAAAPLLRERFTAAAAAYARYHENEDAVGLAGPGVGYIVALESRTQEREEWGEDGNDDTREMMEGEETVCSTMEEEERRGKSVMGGVAKVASDQFLRALADEGVARHPRAAAAVAAATTMPADAVQLATALAPLKSLVDFVVTVPATLEEAVAVRAAVDELEANEDVSTVVPRVKYSLLHVEGAAETCPLDSELWSSPPGSLMLIEFHVHRLVLAAHSPLLHRMFTSGMREAITGRLDLGTDFSPLAVAAMLHFFYAGDFPEGTPVTEMLVLCERYQAALALERIARVVIDECAAVDNVFYLLELAPLLGASLAAMPSEPWGSQRSPWSDSDGAVPEALTELFPACIGLAARNVMAAEAADPAAFRRLPSAAMCGLLAHEALSVPDEETVLGLFVRWAGYGTGGCPGAAQEPSPGMKRSLAEVEEALVHVRFPQLSGDALTALERGGDAGVEGAARLYASSPVMQVLVAEAQLLHQATPTLASDGNGEDANSRLPGTIALDGCRLVSLAAVDKRAASRREPRPSYGINLVYLRDGDHNGVCRFIGSKGGASQWTNPVQSGELNVVASSPVSRSTDPEVIVSGEYTHTSFAGPEFKRGEGISGGWWRVDLGKGRRLRCKYYSMRQDGSFSFPREWELQGSVDGSAESWMTLRQHKGDVTICAPGQWGSWPVEGPASQVPVRYLRVKLTGQTTAKDTAPGPEAWRLCICSLELYGVLTGCSHAAAPEWRQHALG